MSSWLHEDEVQERPGIPAAVEARFPSMEQCARETYGLPAEWQACLLKAHGDGPSRYVELRGAVYKTLLKSGKWKGQTNYKKPEPGTEATVSVPTQLFDNWVAAWERETGYCHKCHGTGWLRTGFGASGEKYRSCTKCKETGWATL